ncbi:hypothetical protein O181_025995 [Austropuccinia psidii MF-1]|uniref:Uncharacterized protein n=1 Tax=Austropuccinia psidii MF-1 TaxID=1389203 RepID=A0A9Q3H1R4_9BASI|nr:hypothetical protein [Austropuccinia psidii MF-1]
MVVGPRTSILMRASLNVEHTAAMWKWNDGKLNRMSSFASCPARRSAFDSGVPSHAGTDFPSIAEQQMKALRDLEAGIVQVLGWWRRLDDFQLRLDEPSVWACHPIPMDRRENHAWTSIRDEWRRSSQRMAPTGGPFVILHGSSTKLRLDLRDGDNLDLCPTEGSTASEQPSASSSFIPTAGLRYHRPIVAHRLQIVYSRIRAICLANPALLDIFSYFSFWKPLLDIPASKQLKFSGPSSCFALHSIQFPLYIPPTQFAHLYNISQPTSVLQSKSPSYQIKTRFDFQSVNLALNQEWIELDLFLYGLKTFSARAFKQAGLTKQDRYLIRFFADQEVSHATVLSNMLGGRAAKQCKYQYPFKTVREFIDFSQKLTRWGESGVYGFLPFLENPNSAQLLLQSIATEARQQAAFRQFEGLFPAPVYHIPGIPQSWAWTLLHPYLVSCPPTNPFIEFDIYPQLNVLNNPSPLTKNSRKPAISQNRTSLSAPGRVIKFEFDKPGKEVGPNKAYKTISHSKTGVPKFAAWVSQFNVTYSKLEDVTGNSAKTVQPFDILFPGQVEYPSINGTMFIALTDTALYVTPSNITLLNPHIVAGPAIYQAD